MLVAKKIKNILLLVFLVSTLASCDEGCFEADQFYNKMKFVSAKPDNFYGDYNDQNGGQIAEWQDTGLVANGDFFVIAISGGWVANGGDTNSNEVTISKLNSCRICIKPITASRLTNCYCSPILDNGLLQGSPAQLKFETPQKEMYRLDGQINNTDCNPANYDNPDVCTCKPHALDSITNDELFSNRYFSFSLAGIRKDTTTTPRPNGEDNKDNYDSCANKIGFGAYISLWSRGANAEAPRVAYHLLSPRVVCAISRDSSGRCLDENKVDRTKVIYTSPDAKIFLNTENPSSPPLDVEYHKFGDRVKLAIYDQYFTDNGGKYNVEFLRGVIDESEEAGLIAGIVRTMERYLFGSSTYNDKLGAYITKTGVVEFMYKAILQDQVVASVISISLVMYVCFYGLAFFMGMVDYGKKEVMMRILKIGLVIMFTNQKSWSMYNEFVVKFFKNGMDSIVAMITEIFESNMDPTLGSISAKEEANSANIDVGRKFIYIDNLIKDLISQPTMAKIFGLLLIPGKGFFAVIYIPVIFLLIGYFIYTMLDVALKYIINLLKISIGLALGPIFILFSLFEKTKDMFKNWVAFVASRSLEIVILFAMLHPFLLIIDTSFKTMLGFRACTESVNVGIMKYSIYKSQGVDRGIFQWFEFFLKIAALIFVTKSICDKAAYISGQLISIGEVSNANASETGRGQSGFNMASSIASGALGLVKEAVTSGRAMKMAKFGGRLVAKNLTKALRAEIGTSGSINDMVNNAFKSIGIRNRGIRSYMRDRQVDNALSEAKNEADKKELTGEDRDSFIRAKAMEKLNTYRANNKNEAALLGLDNKNILKRFDQKLIKEPMKNFVKQRAEELKKQGIYGKDAREKIEMEVQGWAKKNISENVRSEKVSEFMKKTSMQSYLKSNAEMNASEAANFANKLISRGGESDVKKAQDFIDKFRENAVKNQVDLEKKRQDNIRDGGNITKALAVGGNILGKVMAVPGAAIGAALAIPAVPISYIGAKIMNAAGYNAKGIGTKELMSGYQRYRNSIRKKSISNALGKNIRGFFGKVDNAVVDAKNHAMGMKIPFMGNHAIDKNPRKTLRKFDRKLHRMLAENQNQEKLKKDGLNIPDLKDVKDKEVFVQKDDSTLAKSLKYGAQAVLSPVLIPTKVAQGKLGRYASFRKSTAKIEGVLEKGESYLKENAGDGNFKKGLKKLGRFAIVPLRKVFTVAKNQDSRNLELKNIHKDAKMDALKSLAKKKNAEFFAEIESRKKENSKKRENENDQQHQERIQRIEERAKNKGAVNDLAVLLREIDKKTQKEIKKEIQKEAKDRERKIKESGEKIDKNRKKEILKEIKEKKYQDLTRIETNAVPGETVFERLSKLEACRDDKNLDLKSVYTQSINESIKKLSSELASMDSFSQDKTTKLKELEDLKDALFIDTSKVTKHKNEYILKALEEVYKKSSQDLNLDVIGVSDPNIPNTTPPSIPKEKIIPEVEEKKSNFEKQKKVIVEAYEGNKIAEESLNKEKEKMANVGNLFKIDEGDEGEDS